VNEPDRLGEALKKLAPGAMPPQLMARLTAARPQPGGVGRLDWRGVLFRWLLPVAASACVAVGTFFWLEHHRQPDLQSDSRPVVELPRIPMESQDYLLSTRPIGIVVAPNQQPYRIMEVEWLEHETVPSGDGGAAFHTATTRRDVVPVALELY
jgi:hypothetical protein